MAAPKKAAGNAGKGRPKGSPNKANRELKQIAQQYTDEAVLTLAEIMRDVDAPAVARGHCAETLLAYGHGKPKQAVDVTVNPIADMTNDELVAAIAFLKSSAGAGAGAATPG